MKRLNVVVAACIAASLVPAAAAAAATRGALPNGSTSASSPRRIDAPITPGAERVPGEIIVRFDDSADAAARAAARGQAEATRLRKLPVAGLELARVERGQSVHEAIVELERDANVVYAEPNYLYHSTAMPNDPRYSQLWGLNNTSDTDIDAPEAWDVTTGSSSVVVAIVDSGVAYDNPDLAPNMWRNAGETGDGKESNGLDDDGNGKVDDSLGWDFVDNDANPSDWVGHGTHVAGTVGAKGNDGYGVAGVNWNVKLMPVRVLGENGSGSTAQIAAGFAYAGRMGARVVNASLGGPSYSQAIEDAIAGAPNTLFVASAGNSASNNDLIDDYPCNSAAPNLICVASTDSNDNLASHSSYGATTVDLAAPGVGIVSDIPSFARPFLDNFELDLASWSTGGTNNSWDRVQDSAGYFASDSPTGTYLADTDSWIGTTSPVNLGGLRECKIRYSINLDVPQGDAFSIEASTDAATWTDVGGWYGSSGGQWLGVSDDLSDFDGQTNVYIRFRLTSDALTNGDGASLDNVALDCFGAYDGDEFRTASGTSMAAPHVSGAAGLLWAHKPDATVVEIRAALLGGVDLLSSLTGKTVTGGRLNAANALNTLVPDVGTTTDETTGSTTGEGSTGSTTTSDSTTGGSTTSGSATGGSTTGGSTTGGSSIPPEETLPEEPVAEEPASQPAPVETVHARAISLRLRGELRAVGRVRVTDGFRRCAAGVPVAIKRNGVVVKRTRTNSYGYYKVSLPIRRGRYRTLARKVRVGRDALDVCASVSSVPRTR